MLTQYRSAASDFYLAEGHVVCCSGKAGTVSLTGREPLEHRPCDLTPAFFPGIFFCHLSGSFANKLNTSFDLFTMSCVQLFEHYSWTST